MGGGSDWDWCPRRLLHQSVTQELRSQGLPVGRLLGIVRRTAQASAPTWLCTPGLPPLRVAARRREAEWRTSDPPPWSPRPHDHAFVCLIYSGRP